MKILQNKKWFIITKLFSNHIFTLCEKYSLGHFLSGSDFEVIHNLASSLIRHQTMVMEIPSTLVKHHAKV